MRTTIRIDDDGTAGESKGRRSAYRGRGSEDAVRRSQPALPQAAGRYRVQPLQWAARGPVSIYRPTLHLP